MERPDAIIRTVVAFNEHFQGIRKNYELRTKDFSVNSLDFPGYKPDPASYIFGSR